MATNGARRLRGKEVQRERRLNDEGPRHEGADPVELDTPHKTVPLDR